MSKYDPVIMSKLLKSRGIRENVQLMKPETLKWFIELLVEQGIYEQYVKERGKNGRRL